MWATYLLPFFCCSVLCWWYHHSPLPRVYKQNNERETNLYLFPVEGSSSEFPFQKCFACLVRTKHICYSFRHTVCNRKCPNETSVPIQILKAGRVRWNCSLMETSRTEEVFVGSFRCILTKKHAVSPFTSCKTGVSPIWHNLYIFDEATLYFAKPCEFSWFRIPVMDHVGVPTSRGLWRSNPFCFTVEVNLNVQHWRIND